MDSDYCNSRLPPSSSELVALSTLTPPSPILSPSLLPTSITSGDIPILLDGLDFSTNYRYSIASSVSFRRASARASLYELHLPQSCSCGTFGPISIPAYQEPDKKDIVTQNRITMVPCPEACMKDPTKRSERASEDLHSNFKTQYTTIKRAGSRDAGTDGGVSVPLSETITQNDLFLPRVGLKVQFSPPPSRYDNPQEVSRSVNTSPKPMDESLAYFTSHDEKTRSFLEEVKVVLSIDQESFRSVNPSFKFSGCFKRTFDDRRQQSESTAQFVPVSQHFFHFHYAPFEGLPVLRRIFVDDNESRDYISREASLGLKSNGVYAVHGTELAIHPVIDETRERSAVELHWEFVYKVDDRRVGPSKKIIDGEKNLTPLSFSCSPALLHPSQGKRVNLLHIMKKSVTAKLTAEKLQLSELQTVNQAASLLIPARPPLVQGTASNWHRRALSYGRQPEIATVNAEQCTDLQGNRSHFDGPDPHYGAHRRRASSAGEWKNHDPPRRLPIQRHIVNPARLAQMLEAKSIERSTTQAAQPEFYPLAPNPHPYRSRARNGGCKNARG